MQINYKTSWNIAI